MHRFSKMQLLRAAGLPAAALLLGAASRPETTVSPRVLDAYGKLPLSFEANRGQAARQVKFLSRGRGYTLFLTEGPGALLSLHGREGNAALRMTLRGANAHAPVSGADALPGKSNYFIGNDPGQWRTDIPTYGAVKYTGVYSGIDLVYHGNQQLLEYDFVVAPGADPRAIDIRFQGAQELSVNGDGALVIGLGGDEVVEHAPVVYQEIGGARVIVAGRYVIRDKGRVGFEVAKYDRGRVLVIDPVLVYSMSLPLVGAHGIAVDASGNAYFTDGNSVVKLNVASSELVYRTYLGGSGPSSSGGIAVDASGQAYVTGSTSSPDFPTTSGAFQRIFGGNQDIFVSKLNATGSALLYSSFIGGSGGDYASSIATDRSGNAYVTGHTYSFDFPTTPGAFQGTRGGDRDTAFVVKLNTAGSASNYSTYLGGSGRPYGGDVGFGITVDASGNAYVTGETFSTDFPVTPGAYQNTWNGYSSPTAFVSKLNVTGQALVYSTYLGGSSMNFGMAVEIDSSGNAYVTGETLSRDFPVTPDAFQKILRGSGSAFVSKFNTNGSALIYSTYLGGSGTTWGWGVGIDGTGDAYVTGYTYDRDFPTTPDAFQTTFRGGYYDAFMTKLNATGSALLYSTYLGEGSGTSIAVDAAGNAYVTAGAFFKLKFSDFGLPGPQTTATISGPLGNSGWYLGPVTVTLIATPGTSPVSTTYYSIDGAPFQGYHGPVSISAAGTHRLFYYSVDSAGEQETPTGGETLPIDAKPVSHIGSLPAAASSPNFSVQWSGTGATTAIHSYSVYVSDNGKPFAPWLSNVGFTRAWYSGSLLHNYAFYSIATDYAGSVEIKTAADATTQVPQMPGDVNGDRKIDCMDIALVKASLGKNTGQAVNPNADVNKDGVVNVLDLAIVAQKLAPGTACP